MFLDFAGAVPLLQAIAAREEESDVRSSAINALKEMQLLPRTRGGPALVRSLSKAAIRRQSSTSPLSGQAGGGSHVREDA